MSLYAVLGAFSQGLVYALMALGVYLTFRVLDFPDLTVDGSLPLGAAVAAVMITKGINPFVTLPVAFAAGMAAGFVTAFLSTKLKIMNLLASILTMIALYSINIRIMGKPNIPFINEITIFDYFPWITEFMISRGLPGRYANIALSLAIFFVVVISIKLILDFFLHTDLGLAMRATGDNENMIRAQGVNTHFTIMLGVALSNGLVALCGALVAQDQGLADVTMGVGTIVAGLASVIIGEALLGEMTVFKATLGVVIGSVIYRLAIAFALSLRIGGFVISPSDLKLITAILVVFALMFPEIRSRIKIGVLKRGGGGK